MKTTLLIDGDEYLFKACSVVERETRWDDQNHVLYCNREEAWDNFTRMVDQLSDKLSASDRVLCFSGARPYFREVLFPSYKGGRAGRKPLCYADLRDLCGTHYTVRALDGLEADDVMGILATKPVLKQDGWDYRRIICSQDKDMQTVPGWLWREGVLTNITEAQATYFHMYQTLMGDHTDNYPGCPGMGPARAEKLLTTERREDEPETNPEIWWARIVAAYKKSGLTEADALLQARLARILQWSDWDYDKKEPILWSPRPNNT